ncbi:MAG: pseudouridine synthase [Candidatus Borkfalkiaceae bacterium]|nr:pseudouridine synthase [Christensenellaceae bacterium]
MRINKFLENCGVGSRRYSDELIKQGKVKVNGKIATLGQEIDERKDCVVSEGKKLALKNKNAYYIMNKPKDYVCTVKDDLGRKTVMDLLPKNAGRVVPVGRLDYDSEGLLIFTDDGELVNRLTHPRNEVPKTYVLKVEGEVTEAMLNKIRNGVEVDGKLTKKCNISVTDKTDKFTKLAITITEGRNRQVRKMFEAVGKEVVFLKRIKIGDLKLTGLDRGSCRPLSKYEIDYLKNL